MLTVAGRPAENIYHPALALMPITEKHISMPGTLSPEDLDALSLTRRNVKSFAAGQTMIRQGEPCNDVFVLLNGWALCQKMLEDGGRQIVDLVLPGNIFGFNLNGSAAYGVEAKTDCKAAVLSREEFKRLLLNAPGICLKCAEVFASAEGRAFERLSQVGRLSAKQRVASLIVELACRLRDVQDFSAARLELPLTQIDIADILGLAHETVCRVLVAMRNMKLTTWRNGALEIHDLDGLIEISGNDPEALGFDPCTRDSTYVRLPRAA